MLYAKIVGDSVKYPVLISYIYLTNNNFNNDENNPYSTICRNPIPSEGVRSIL